MGSGLSTTTSSSKISVPVTKDADFSPDFPAIDRMSLDGDSQKEQSSKTNEKKESSANRTGIHLVNYKCRKKKAKYSKCVSNFYDEKFLQGKALNQEEECGDLFETYRRCYLKGIKEEFFDKGRKKPKEGSVLAEEFDDSV